MQTIYIDISNKTVIPTIYAKQGDVGRRFLAVLTDGSVPYLLPAGYALSVWYEGDSGEGNYTHIGEKSAFSVDGNKVAVEMITQMLSVPGKGSLCLSLNYGENQIASWNIEYVIESVPGSESDEAKEYYTAFSKAVSELPYPDETLSVPGKAADAAATGIALAGKLPAVESAEYPGCYYRTANGTSEWLNPPMVIGTEYRTAERYAGKAVYAKAVSLGNLPNAATKQVRYTASGVVATNIVNIRGIAMNESGRPQPLPLDYNGLLIEIHANAEFVFVRTIDDNSTWTAVAVVKYTKD